jgi:hypothetical protein
MTVVTSSRPFKLLGGVAVSDSRKAEHLPAGLVTSGRMVQPRYYLILAKGHAPPSETTLTNRSVVLQAIKGTKFGKPSGPNSVPNRVLKHLLKKAITFLLKRLK